MAKTKMTKAAEKYTAKKVQHILTLDCGREGLADLADVVYSAAVKAAIKKLRAMAMPVSVEEAELLTTWLLPRLSKAKKKPAK